MESERFFCCALRIVLSGIVSWTSCSGAGMLCFMMLVEGANVARFGDRCDLWFPINIIEEFYQ